jgi:RNA polymerase sigma factor FliA
MNASRTYNPTAQENRDALILANVPFVARILSTMSFVVKDVEARDNLHSAGLVGLVEAANSFDPTLGVAFRTYAYRRIRGAIVDELRRQSLVSQEVLKCIGIVKKTYESLTPPVTPEALAESSGLSMEQVVECLEAMRFIRPDNWNDLSDTIHGSWRSQPHSPEHEVEAEELRTLLADAVECLPQRERLSSHCTIPKSSPWPRSVRLSNCPSPVYRAFWLPPDFVFRRPFDAKQYDEPNSCWQLPAPRFAARNRPAASRACAARDSSEQER